MNGDQSSEFSRRGFLAAVGGAVAATQLGVREAFAEAPVSASMPAAAGKKIPFGLEMYSVRGEMMKDMAATLKAVAGIGYEVVEFYAPYYDWTIPYAKTVKTMMDDVGLRCFSTHNNQAAEFVGGDAMAKAIELNQILGARIIVMASTNVRGAEGWKQLGGTLTKAVEQLKPHGLTAGFHNHQTEWAKVDGEKRAMDILAENTPAEFVLQFDVGTCVQAGADPVAWIKQNPGRIKSLHLKDWAPGPPAPDRGTRVLFGEGLTPWKEVCQAAEAVGGVEYYLMEQEGSRFPEIETAKRCFDLWKGFRAKEFGA
jgi:sugar phosphate isomerase/epimerase